MAANLGGRSSISLDQDTLVSIQLFKDVQNLPDVKQKVITGCIQAALVKPSLVCDHFSLIVAANKACHKLKYQKMKTKSVHTEMIYSLSPTHSISESLKLFGIQDSDKELLMVCIYKNESETEAESYFSQIDGHRCSLDEISTFSNKEQLKKIYKTTDQELDVGTLAEAITCRIATKDAS